MRRRSTWIGLLLLACHLHVPEDITKKSTPASATRKLQIACGTGGRDRKFAPEVFTLEERKKSQWRAAHRTAGSGTASIAPPGMRTIPADRACVMPSKLLGLAPAAADKRKLVIVRQKQARRRHGVVMFMDNSTALAR